MRYYLSDNVFDAAIKRIEYIFDEFENVIVSFSGGKDSTVVLNLALMVAERRGRLSLKVCFLDQEAEWQTVIDYIRVVMADPRIEPMWFQMPIRLFNATSSKEPWLYCWEETPGVKWMREKEPIARTENIYGTPSFIDLFNKILDHEFQGQKACDLTGVRGEESPKRMKGLTTHATYKHVTWGKQRDKKKGQYAFHPIYDWSYTDVWTAIHKFRWPYCAIYDYQWQHGLAVQNMRVSNLHHETAVTTLFYLQEIEQDTWNKLCVRLPGVQAAGQLKGDSFTTPKDLPYMFADWREYRDHLLKNLIQEDTAREKFRVKFGKMDVFYTLLPDKTDMYRHQITSILCNDYHFTRLHGWEGHNSDLREWIRVVKKGMPRQMQYKNKYLDHDKANL